MTHPLTFQGLSSFFLEHFSLLHEKCFLHSLIQPSYLPIISTTIWQILWVVHYSRVLPILLLHLHLFFFHKSGLWVVSPGIASRPSSINFFLTLSIVRIPTLSTLLICSFVTFSEYLPSSQFKQNISSPKCL